MALLLYQTSLPYWLFALALLKLALAEGAPIGTLAVLPVDATTKRVVTAATQPHSDELMHVAERETHTEEMQFTVRHPEVYLGPHLGVSLPQEPEVQALLRGEDNHRVLSAGYRW